MPAPDYVIRQGDFGQTITSVLTDENGPVVLDTATVRFRMAPLEGGNAIVAGTADKDAQEVGQVSYEWQEGDTDTAGHFLAEFEADFPGDVMVSFPNGGYLHIEITPQLTEAP